MEQRPFPNTLCKLYSKPHSKSLLIFYGIAVFPAAADSALTPPELQLRSCAGDSDIPSPELHSHFVVRAGWNDFLHCLHVRPNIWQTSLCPT